MVIVKIKPKSRPREVGLISSQAGSTPCEYFVWTAFRIEILPEYLRHIQ